VAAFSILGIIMTLPQWYRPDGPDQRQVAAEVLRFVAAGLLRPGHTTGDPRRLERAPRALVMPDSAASRARRFPN
jgi:hypothetical protein